MTGSVQLGRTAAANALGRRSATLSLAGEVSPGAEVVRAGCGATCENGKRGKIALSRMGGCALTASGDVACWGANPFGEVGNGSFGGFASPTALPAYSSGVSKLWNGITHSCALLTSGAVQCWESNDKGGLGTGSTLASVTPSNVNGLSNVSAVFTGDRFTCALANGGVRCWGFNNSGELGKNSTGDSWTPVPVHGLTSGVTAFGIGTESSCAVVGGGVKCWGVGGRGAIGDGFTQSRMAPVDVIGLGAGAGVTDVAVGHGHACTLLSGGTVKCWGTNWGGQLGNGSWTDSTSPVDVSISGVAKLRLGNYHSCAVLANGALKCWGANYYAQLGDNTYAHSSTPVDVVGLTSGVSDVALSESSTCALLSSGGVKCWGDGQWGQLGDGLLTRRATPADVTGLGSGVTHLYGRAEGFCAVVSGEARCWGQNLHGTLGSIGNAVLIPQTVGLSNVSSVSASGQGHLSCALFDDGTVKCWGNNKAHGLLGTNIDHVPTPTTVNGLSNLVSPSNLEMHICGVTSSGGAVCIGENGNGKLGDGTTTRRTTPVTPMGLGSGVVSVSAGASHTCAVLADGTARCWGDNDAGQLGDGTTNNSTTPVTVTSLTNIAAIKATQHSTCALLKSGGMKCWGANWFGMLGDGTTTTSSTPVDVMGISDAVALAAGEFYTCALHSDKKLSCWGQNVNGNFGDNSSTSSNSPVPAANGLTNIVAVDVGHETTCVLLETGTMQCFGRGYLGELGNGAAPTRAQTPVSNAGSIWAFLQDCRKLLPL